MPGPPGSSAQCRGSTRPPRPLLRGPCHPVDKQLHCENVCQHNTALSEDQPMHIFRDTYAANSNVTVEPECQLLLPTPRDLSSYRSLFIPFRYIVKRIQLPKMAAENESSPRSAGNTKDYALKQPIKVKVKVKVTLQQATKAQKGSRGIALFFL